MQKMITLGKFGATHGVRGWIKLFSYTNPTNEIIDYPCWTLKLGKQTRIIELEDSKPYGQNLLVKIKGIDTPEDAKQLLTNGLIEVDRAELPETDDNEFYWDDLVGLSVINQDQVNLGTVESLFETGANDVIIVKAGDGRERLIPYIDDIIKEINLKTKTITVDWDPEF